MANPDSVIKNIPHAYGDNKIILMIRDPWTLFSYWETRKDVEDNLRNEIKQKGLTVSKSILRVYDITDSSEEEPLEAAFDYELKDLANSWYIHTQRTGRRWIVDIGLLCTTGEFFRLARSNAVSAPSTERIKSGKKTKLGKWLDLSALTSSDLLGRKR